MKIPDTLDPKTADELLANVKRIAKALDTAVPIPFTKHRLGADAVVGFLIPGVGDVLTLGVGGYIIVAAVRLGLPTAIVGRMLLTSATDAALGAIPLVGDLFDITYRANSRNAALLERYVNDPNRTVRKSRWVLVGAVAALVGIAAAGVALSVWLAKLLWNAVF